MWTKNRVLVLLFGIFLQPVFGSTLPSDDAYVTVKNGQLTVNGERQRYWAAIGKLYSTPQLLPEDSPTRRKEKTDAAYRSTDLLIQRLQDMGFNAVRLWDAFPDKTLYEPGDGSKADAVDYFIKKAGEKGMRIWLAGLNRSGVARPEDVGIIDDPLTAEAWKTAVASAEKKEIDLRKSVARIWDPRLETLRIERMKTSALHFNQHTGMAWADDPTFAVWELSNEEWWIRRMMTGRWKQLPEFFVKSLLEQWNVWLEKKYKNDDGLKVAWGKLRSGETLGNKTIQLVPMSDKPPVPASLNDANVEAQKALEVEAQGLPRNAFSNQRASDVLEFLVGLQLAHKRREAAALKTWGKSTRLCPTIYDTGIGYEIQSQYLHQNADAIAHDAYVNGWGPAYEEPDLSQVQSEQLKMVKQLEVERISANRGPWVNWLLKPPGISQGVPWLEHNRVEGKPYFVYETQIQQPAKYRADFPLRIAALASIQDWDWICWHYFSPSNNIEAARSFEKPLDITTGKHPQGYHFTYDEVQSSMMRAAAHLFRQKVFKEAPNPTVFVYGRRSLFNGDSMDYAGSYGSKGMDMFTTTYQYGVRIKIDPEKEDDEVIGPVIPFADRNKHNPYTPTDEIIFDWKKGFLQMDASKGVAWTGLLSSYGQEVKFQNEVVLKDVVIINDPGIFDPVREDEKYIAFSMHSLDGKKLSESKKVSISLMSTSFNTNFSLKKDDLLDGSKFKPSSVEGGKLPVLYARVGATIESTAINGMHYIFRDWHMENIGEGTVSNNSLAIPAGKPIFVIELERKN